MVFKILKSFLKKDINNITNKNIVNVELSLDKFHTIEQHSSIDIVLSHEHTTPILSCSENMINNFSILVKDGTLSLNNTKQFVFNKQKIVLKLPSQELKEIYHTSVGNITTDSSVTEKIIHNGVGSIIVEKFSGDYIETTSVGETYVLHTDSDKLNIQHLGTGDMSFEQGNINDLNVFLSSIGNLNTNGTIIQNGDLVNQGTGDINVNNILNNIEAFLSSLGNINLAGKIKENAKIINNGVGNIKCKGLSGTKKLYTETSSLGNIKVLGNVNEITSINNGVGHIDISQLILGQKNQNWTMK